MTPARHMGDRDMTGDRHRAGVPSFWLMQSHPPQPLPARWLLPWLAGGRVRIHRVDENIRYAKDKIGGMLCRIIPSLVVFYMILLSEKATEYDLVPSSSDGDSGQMRSCSIRPSNITPTFPRAANQNASTSDPITDRTALGVAQQRCAGLTARWQQDREREWVSGNGEKRKRASFLSLRHFCCRAPALPAAAHACPVLSFSLPLAELRENMPQRTVEDRVASCGRTGIVVSLFTCIVLVV